MQSEPTDQDLLALLAKRPEQALELLFRTYYAYLCRVAYRLLPDEGLAEDLVQEVFYEVWRRRNRLSITTSLRAYLRRATVNKTLNHIRDHGKKMLELEEGDLLEEETPSVVQQLEASELQERIDRAVDQLPERCRIVFVLSRFEERSYQEIADDLGISVKTVENQISKALRLLRQALDQFLLPAMLLLAVFWG